MFMMANQVLPLKTEVKLTGAAPVFKTTLSSKGQVAIPKALLDAIKWHAGIGLTVEEVPEGLLIRPTKVMLIKGEKK